jgi:hypothetical protein
LKAVQDAFFHFFSMLLNGAYASKFTTEEVTIIQLATILPIYKVQKI